MSKEPKKRIRIGVFDEGFKYHHYYRGVIRSNIAALLALVVLEDSVLPKER